MTDAPQPTSGSLSAKIIRACPTHVGCPLECSHRRVEDLGQIATFDMRDERERSIRKRLIEAYHQWQEGRSSP